MIENEKKNYEYPRINIEFMVKLPIISNTIICLIDEWLLFVNQIEWKNYFCLMKF